MWPLDPLLTVLAMNIVYISSYVTSWPTVTVLAMNIVYTSPYVTSWPIVKCTSYEYCLYFSVFDLLTLC